MTRPIKRGEVWWVSFEQSVGGEIQKTRPAIVVSNNAANTALNRVVVVPLTSRTDNIYPGESIVEINGRKSKVLTSQIATASKNRFGKCLGAISASDLKGVEDAILLHLGILR